MAKANIFQQEIGSFLKERYLIAERLDDANRNRNNTFQVSKKPYDYFGALSNGKFWGAEVKKVATTRFPLSNLSQDQRKSLMVLEDNNCLAWIFLNWRFRDKLHRVGYAIWIPFSDYCDVEYLAVSDGRKSLKPSDFDKQWFIGREAARWIVPYYHPLYKLL